MMPKWSCGKEDARFTFVAMPRCKKTPLSDLRTLKTPPRGSFLGYAQMARMAPRSWLGCSVFWCSQHLQSLFGSEVLDEEASLPPGSRGPPLGSVLMFTEQALKWLLSEPRTQPNLPRLGISFSVLNHLLINEGWKKRTKRIGGETCSCHCEVRFQAKSFWDLSPPSKYHWTG